MVLLQVIHFPFYLSKIFLKCDVNCAIVCLVLNAIGGLFLRVNFCGSDCLKFIFFLYKVFSIISPILKSAHKKNR